jgi:hypothetical protein
VNSFQDLARRFDDVAAPPVDVDALVAKGEQRLRRHRMTAVLATVVVLAALAVSGVVAGSLQHQSQGPIDKPTRTHKAQRVVEPQGTRPLVYADGTTVHVGDKTIEAEEPVAFIDATNDGAVYEASLDGTLWFTDGTTTSVIGTSGLTAAPTAHAGVVTAGESGSLVVWADVAGRENQIPTEFVVYDTSRREEVARIPFTERGHEDSVIYVDKNQVYFNPDPSTPGCWASDVNDIRPCKNPHLFRFDVASGQVRLAQLDAEMARHARIFKAVAPNGHVFYGAGAYFQQIGRRLGTVTSGGDPTTLTRTNGEEVRLRLPSGFRPLGQEMGGSVITTSQWLDDEHIVVWANGGGGDLPAQRGDLLVCELPDGICRVAVPRSSHPYVAP